MRKLLKIGGFILIALSIARLCQHATDGFQISKINRNTFEMPGAASADDAYAQEILTQPFTYLARGKQSFVFLSQDQKSVLKLLNNHYQRKIALWQLIPGMEKRVAYFRRKLDLGLASYQLSATELRGETGVLYLHLQKTDHLRQQVTIIDRLGIAHQVDLDQTAFILQKSATPAYVQLKAWIDQGDLPAAERGLSSLLDLLKTRQNKEVADRDPLIRTNIGFLGERALFLDLGPFSKNSLTRSSESRQQEIQKITHSLRQYLAKEAPSLALFLDEELARRI